MALSKCAWKEAKIAKLENRSLPDNSFVDKNGRITLCPIEAYAVLPFGGYKGYALGLLVEILTASLVNSDIGLKKSFYEIERTVLGKKVGKAYRGALFIAIDPARFVDMNKFKKNNEELIRQLKKSRCQDRVNKIFLPGEKAYSLKEKCLKRGWFDINEKIWRELLKIANL